MATFRHGKSAYFALGTALVPATASDWISDTTESVNMPRKIDSAETTSFGSDYKTYIGGLAEGSFSINGRYDATVDENLSDLIGVVDVAFEYGPAGNGTGMPKYSGLCVLSQYDIKAAVNDVVGYTAEFLITGHVDLGTF